MLTMFFLVHEQCFGHCNSWSYVLSSIFIICYPFQRPKYLNWLTCSTCWSSANRRTFDVYLFVCLFEIHTWLHIVFVRSLSNSEESRSSISKTYSLSRRWLPGILAPLHFALRQSMLYSCRMSTSIFARSWYGGVLYTHVFTTANWRDRLSSEYGVSVSPNAHFISAITWS